jgi:hypothetical protein
VWKLRSLSWATMLREAKPASPRTLLCSRCAVFHELACHQALITELSKAVDRERPLVADQRRPKMPPEAGSNLQTCYLP